MAEGTQLPPQLLAYWTKGKGAALIAWDTPGDFARCETEVQAAIVKGGGKPLPDRVVAGLCATMHKIVTGGSPGHGAAE